MPKSIQFLRLLAETDKAEALATVCARLRLGQSDPRHFEVAPESFDAVPGKPFAYWVSSNVRMLFGSTGTYLRKGRTAVNGLTTGDDFRFVRARWEVLPTHLLSEHSQVQGTNWRWVTYAKGGDDSPFYSRFPMVLYWHAFGKEMKAFSGTIIRSEDYFFKPGLTWPLRARRFGPQCRPRLSVFSVRGYSAIAPENELLRLLGLANASAFDYLYKVCLGRHGFPEFVVGILKQLPVPDLSATIGQRLEVLSRRAWSLKRTLDTTAETSHAFLLPIALRHRLGVFDAPAIEAELARIQAEIDDIAFDLYGFSEADRQAVMKPMEDDDGAEVDSDDEDGTEAEAPSADALLSWAVGVAFGRFDWRLATGERPVPVESDPFDPLPAKSPGMLPNGSEPFHRHAGILLDDKGHPHDLAHLVEEVLIRVDTPVPEDVRRWLQRDFFLFHLQRYSKSRRKAPIYWPLATASGSYTLWLYYPGLTSQTLYTAVNDFVEPKLKQVSGDVAAVRVKGASRSRVDEKQFETLQTLEQELIELRDTLLKLAPTYKPNHDDGVQITAAPLWPLFRHKPWQKVLKDTWARLEKGDYDWAHLAMNYWPDRVREKCKTDKSLAIAHGLEDLYEEPPEQAKKKRGRKASGE